LLNCGLKFPLAGESGSPDVIKGVGGTRNCDWLFTDEAVFIDTAGRYTTQDSHAEVDKAAWLGFLRLLKRHRRRQPLNGVLVAISLSDLSTLNEDERRANAVAIRRRVRELQDELGVRPPVYVLFTKADRIAGFVEFFSKLGREEREQVWGVTFPLDDGRNDGGAIAGFLAGFDGLLGRLNDQLLERVQDEGDLQRRRLIYSFPQQLASLRDIANEFLTDCFRPSRLEARPLPRGVYFTSGTQDGMPIDRLLGTMAATFGLPRQAVTAFSGRGRSYFLSRLIKEVVLGEAALVGLDKKVERRAKFISYGAYAA
jgi:type VI secretion system protein ImpL